MAFYTDRSIAEVAQRNNLVDIASLYVTLRRNGSDYVALCPFHNEKTPSFHINEEKQLFYCFGCGTGGNIFDFVQKIENLDFVDSVEFLAQRAGVTLETAEKVNNYRKENDYHEKCVRLFEINKAAARHYVDNLVADDAKVAQEYAKKRGIHSGSIKAFGLGFAKDEWRDLLEHLLSLGYKEDDIIDAGLAVRNENNKIYDKFRNRLMFPIIDIRGNVIAFSGRALGDDKAKYMNSPETPIFQKGKNLFGLNLAKKVSKEDGVILVEGNMDVVSLVSHGIKNVVAGLGTAFTSEQAQLLKRYCREIFVCYDSDEAGKKAAIKNIDILLSAGNRVKVIEITGAKDPDEFIIKKGVESFKGLIKSAIPALEYKILTIKGKFDLSDASGKIDFVTQAAVILSEVENSVEREIYVRNISRETEISEKAIFTEINKLILKSKRTAEIKERRPNLSQISTVKSEYKFAEKNLSDGQNKNTYRSERMLLNLAFFNKYALAEAEQNGGEELFSSKLNKKLFSKISSFKKTNEQGDAATILSETDEEIKKIMAAVLFMEFKMDDVKKAANDVIKKLKGEQMKSKIDILVKEGNMAEAMKLIKLQKEGENL